MIRNKSRFILSVLIFVLLIPFSFLTSGTVLAASDPIYSNTFDTYDNIQGWSTDGGDWQIINGYYQVEINGKNTKAVSMYSNSCADWQNYSIEFSAKGEAGVDQHVDFYMQDENNYYDVDLRWGGWVDSNNIYFARVKNGYKTFLTPITPFKLDKGKWYQVKIKSLGNGKFQVLVNGVLALDVEDPDNSFSGGCLRFRAWSGAVPYVKFQYDNLLLYDGLSILHPLIIIPGLGGSFNRRAFLGLNGGSWKITPFVTVYDNLIETLKQAGYQEGENLFVWNYDWRRPVNEITSNLKTYIDSQVKPKIKTGSYSIIGHSLGGLTARNYAQQYSDPQLDKVVTIGSPHQGATRAYLTWAGGQLWDETSWASLALELFIHLNQPKYGGRVQVIRNLSPVIKDLLPTYAYLYDLNNQPVTPSVINDWLTQLNQGADPANLITFYGTQKSTLNTLILETVESGSVISGIWPDGQVVNKTYSSDGDGTVLAKSAQRGAQTHQLSQLNHLEIISKREAIEQILNQLDINASIPYLNPPPSRSRALLFFVHSPVEIQVINQSTGDVYGYNSNNSNAFYSQEDNLLVIPNAVDNNYQIKLIGTGAGLYTLEVGASLTDGQVIWQSDTGQVNDGQTITYSLYFDPNNNKLDLSSNFAIEESILALMKKLDTLDIVRRNRRLKLYLRLAKRYLELNNRRPSYKSRYLAALKRYLTFMEMYLLSLTSKESPQALTEVKHYLDLIDQKLLNQNRSTPIYPDSYMNLAKRLNQHSQTLINQIKPKVSDSTNQFIKYQINLITNNLNSIQTSQPEYIFYQIHDYLILTRLRRYI